MKNNKGFTLIELMVVIAIIAALSAIVLAFLGSSKTKGNDARVVAQLKQMVAQSQVFTGANTAVVATTSAIVGAAGGTLFTDTNATNSLYRLANSFPSGTVIYYAKNGISPIAGGYWAFAASTSNGSYCVDWTGVGRANTAGTPMTVANASTQYPNLAASYICN